MISKELLSEVMNEGNKVNGVDFIKKWNTIIYFIDGGNTERTINIYELAYKCKIWSDVNGYLLHSGVAPIIGFNADVMRRFTDDMWKAFNENTEPEAIFKACEWILEQKDKE